MKRKVIQLAEKTLVVSLPASWTAKYNVRKGDEVEVEEVDGKVVVSGDKELSEGSMNVDVSMTAPMVKRILGALYKTGYDEVTIHFERKEELKAIKEVILEEFQGFDVVRETGNSITMRGISKVEIDEFETVMRRIFLIIISMAEDSLDGIKNGNKEKLKEVVLRDKEVNRYDDFCRRIINKRGYSKFRRSAPVYFIVEQLEKIADVYKDISNYALANNVSISKETEEVYQEITGFFRQFYELYYKFDLKRLADFGKKGCGLNEKVMLSFKETTGEELVVLIYLHSSLEKTFDMNGPLMAAMI